MHDPSEEEPRATLRLRTERFALMWAVLGYKTDVEIANAAGYSRKTIARARTGQLGEVFVANTVHTLQQHADTLAKYGLNPTLDELFVVEQQTESRAA